MAYPSTFVTIQNEVVNKLRLDSTADLAKVKDWINGAYYEACVETEALQNFATMTLTANTSTYTLDSQIARIKQMRVTPVGSTQSLPLEPVSVEEMLVLTAGTTSSQPNTGGPNRYTVFGVDKIQFYPTPTSADTVTMYYVKYPTALSADADTPSIPEPYATELLVNGACYKGAVFADDPKAQLFQQAFEVWKDRLRGHLRRKTGSFTRQFRLTGTTGVVPHDPSVDLG